MKVRTVLRGLVIATTLGMLAALLPQMGAAAPKSDSGRYLVRARSAADYAGLRAKAVKDGARVVRDLRQINTMVVKAPAAARNSLAADRRTAGIARGQMRKLAAEVGAPNLDSPGLRGATRLKAKAPAATTAAGINPDPAWDYKGLLWDYRRIGLPKGWKTTAGSSKVTVGVADTGLDFTHSELAPKVKGVFDFTPLEDPPICKTFFGMSDEDLAAEFGGPATTDWNGHGSWIGGRIAAALDGQGINGIAPKVNLVALKIAQWCGSTFDDTLLAAFVKAADLGLDVVNISFGGFTDISTPEGAQIYQAYIDAVAYARSKGTIIVASAGNDHVRVGAGGRILSHGATTTPGTPPEDFIDPFGQVQLPAGRPAWSTSPPPTGSTSRPRPAARRAPSATPATRTPSRPSHRTSTPPASRPATATTRPGRASRTSSPTTPTSGRGSTSPDRAGPASSTWATTTGAARPGSPSPPTT